MPRSCSEYNPKSGKLLKEIALIDVDYCKELYIKAGISLSGNPSCPHASYEHGLRLPVAKFRFILSAN